MRITTWNMRGSNGKQKLRLIKKRIKEDRPTILLLQETKRGEGVLKDRLSKI